MIETNESDKHSFFAHGVRVRMDCAFFVNPRGRIYDGKEGGSSAGDTGITEV